MIAHSQPGHEPDRALDRPEQSAQPVLITGATGFVGRALLSQLRERVRIHCLVRESGDHVSCVKEFRFRHIRDPEVEQAVAESSAVIHCAAQIHGDTNSMHRANVEMTRVLVDHALHYNLPHFIFLSTENVNHRKNDLYTTTKAEAEIQVQRLPSFCILRPTVIYGPGDRRYVGRLAALIKRLPFVPVLGPGTNRFQFTYIDDLVDIIEQALVQRIAGTYTIAGPDSMTYFEFVDQLCHAIGVRKPVIRLPIVLLRPLAMVLDWFMKHPPLTPTQLDNLAEDRDYDITGNVRRFGYTPTPLAAGLRSALIRNPDE